MADRAFERIFAEASAAVESQQERLDPEKQKQKQKKNEESQIRSLMSSMTADDAIERILLAEKERDYFRILELPAPDVDALGRPKWVATPTEISKAYRKLSILVHPDKNLGDKARQAFEALNKAHRLLKDRGELEGILKDHLDRAKARRQELEARASLEERIMLNAQHLDEAKLLRRSEGEALREEIVRQMKEKQERARRRRDAGLNSHAKRLQQLEETQFDEEPGNEGDNVKESAQGQCDSNSEDDGAVRLRRQAMAKRRKRPPSTFLN